MSKLIRELRFGPAKAFKTGSVVGTYPRPLLVLLFDQEGLDIIKEPITFIKPEEIETFCKKKREELDPKGIYAVDFCDHQQKLMLDAYQPQAAKGPFGSFIKTVNSLVKAGCPWATVVVDSLSGLGDSVLGHIADTNGSSLGSALKWAPMIGGKIHQCVGVMTALPSHVVFIAHSSSPVKDEDTTGEVQIAIMLPSKWIRDRIGTLVSQFFYQCKEGGKPILYTSDQGFVKGIGCRWPNDLPAKVQPDFNSIYGKVLK